MYRLVARKNVSKGRRDLIVLGDVNVFSILWAFDENAKAKWKCVKFVVIEDYSHNVYKFSKGPLIKYVLSNKPTFLLLLAGIKLEWKSFYSQFESCKWVECYLW